MTNGFIKSFLTLSGSSLLAQLINLATYFVLPKYYYSPEAFGVFGFFLPIYYVLFELVNLKMDQSIMLPKAIEDAEQLLSFSMLVAFGIAGLSCLVFTCLSFFIDSISTALAICIAVSLLLGGLLQPLLVWLNRNSDYLKMGNIRVLQAVATLVVSILAFNFVAPNINGLIIGFIGGQFIALAIAFSSTQFQFHLKPSQKLIDEYNQFMKFGSVSSMISTLSKNLPAFAIKSFFGDAWLGYYTLASKYLNAPIGIFSNAVGQVYFKEASVANPKQLETLTNKLIKNIALISVVPVLVLLFFGSDLFQLVFGETWEMAGVIIQVFILWYGVAFISGPLSMLLDVKMKLKWELNYSILLLLFRALALATAFIINQPIYVLSIYAIVGIVFNILLLWKIHQLSRSDATV